MADKMVPILARVPVSGALMTNVTFPGLNFTEVTITVPNAILDTDAMYQIIDRTLASQRETHETVNVVI